MGVQVFDNVSCAGGASIYTTDIVPPHFGVFGQVRGMEITANPMTDTGNFTLIYQTPSARNDGELEDMSTIMTASGNVSTCTLWTPYTTSAHMPTAYDSIVRAPLPELFRLKFTRTTSTGSFTDVQVRVNWMY